MESDGHLIETRVESEKRLFVSCLFGFRCVECFLRSIANPMSTFRRIARIENHHDRIQKRIDSL